MAACADAEDLVQDVYVALITKPRRLRTPAALRDWMSVVLRNLYARSFSSQPDEKEVG
jgi:DNA-directed RNA polymerase specialized sigma24 family protein